MNSLRILILAILFWITDATCQAFLYFFPTPYGEVYVDAPWKFFSKGIFYSAGMCAGIALVFLLAALFKNIFTRKNNRSASFEESGFDKVIYILTAVFECIAVFLNHADHELMRYIGTHYSIEMFTSYNMSQDYITGYILDSLRYDARFPFSSLWIDLIPVAVLVCVLVFRKPATRLIIHIQNKFSAWHDSKTSKDTGHILFHRMALAIAWAAILGLNICVWTQFIKHDRLTGEWEFRPSRPQLKVSPVFVAIIRDLFQPRSTIALTPEQAPEYIQKVQKMWMDSEPDSGWKFISDHNPFAKTYQGACPAPAQKPKNIIVIIFESLRSMSLPEFNAEEQHRAMPFLSSILDGTADFMQKNGLHSAYWTHYNTNGQPTIDAFLANHTGIAPHSSKTVGNVFAHDAFRGFPQFLKDHGYHTIAYMMGDPSFDNQIIWTKKWYDETQIFLPWDDRLAFNAMAEDTAKDLKNNPDKPQLRVAWMVTNHEPFVLPDGVNPKFGYTQIAEKMYDTMAFDDDIFKEFIQKLDNTGILKDSLIVISGDHGNDFGEYAQEDTGITGHESCRRNLTWVPFIMISADGRIPAGPQTGVASHMDFAPTLLSAAGICDDNVFMGHSLIDSQNRISLNQKYGNFAFEDDQYGIVVAGISELLFKSSDYMQKNNIKNEQPDIYKKYRETAETWRAVVDYAYENALLTLDK